MVKKQKTNYRWPPIGNKKNIDFLARSLSNNKLSNAYIFSGPDNMGKTKLAEHFAKIILCEKGDSAKIELPCGQCSSCKKFDLTAKKEYGDDEDMAHNDFYIVKKDKDKKNISVEQVRSLIYSLGMSSFSDSYKIAVIKHAETLNEQASNALLKLLEEPKNKVIVFLITSNIENILPTIVSRCQVLNFGPMKIEEINDFLLSNYKANRSSAKNYSRISLGRPALAIKFIEDREFYENYMFRLKSLLEIIKTPDINTRLSLADKLIDKKSSGIESAAVLRRLLEVLQGIYRDMYLIESGLNDLVQNEIIDSELKNRQQRRSINKITETLDEIEKAYGYMEANLGSKLVLENITLSL